MGATTATVDAPTVNMIDADMRLIVATATLAFVATVRPDGSPSLSPKESVQVYDQAHLVFMDIASPGTLANLAADPRIEINAVDFLRRRGYRFAGTAEVHEPGTPVYRWLHSDLVDRNGPGCPAHRAVLIRVHQVKPILSPAYTFGGADEPALIAEWSTQYHVVPGEAFPSAISLVTAQREDSHNECPGNRKDREQEPFLTGLRGAAGFGEKGRRRPRGSIRGD
jgi:hypothetical protein